MSQEDFLSVKDLTRILSVSHDTVYSWIDQGFLRPVSLDEPVQFRVEDVQELVKQHLPSSAHSSRVLIIDDDILVGNSLKILLEKSGFEVVVVPIGLAALDPILREPFDLVLADVRMPGMNGIQTLKAIRELRHQFALEEVPEIIITAYDDENVRAEATRMGISDFILKPFDFKELIAAIESNLKHAT